MLRFQEYQISIVRSPEELEEKIINGEAAEVDKFLDFIRNIILGKYK